MAPVKSAMGSSALGTASQQLRAPAGARCSNRRPASIRTVAAASNRNDRPPLPGFHPSIRQPTPPGSNEASIKPVSQEVAKAIILERTAGSSEPAEAEPVIDNNNQELEELELEQVQQCIDEELKKIAQTSYSAAFAAEDQVVGEKIEQVKQSVKEELEQVRRMEEEELELVKQAALEGALVAEEVEDMQIEEVKRSVEEELEQVRRMVEEELALVKAAAVEKALTGEELEEEELQKVKQVVFEKALVAEEAAVLDLPEEPMTFMAEEAAVLDLPEEPVALGEAVSSTEVPTLDQTMASAGPAAEVVQQWEESLKTKTMDIVFCASECAPWSKTGGLGDVMGAVPKALAARGQNVMVVVPQYDEYEGLVDTGVRKKLWCFGSEHEVTYYLKEENGVNYVFVGHSCFRRPGIYADANGAYEDNQMRFTLLSLACCEAPLVVPLPSLGGETMGQDIMFVANDWHTAMVPVYVAGKFRPHGVFKNARTCLAIHNLSHQGVEQGKMFYDLGIPDEWYGAVEWSFPEWSDQYDPETQGAAINFMKGGIVTADRLLTVSEGYAWEITTPEGGWGLDEVIKGRDFVLDGIVNGIDYDVWNPAVDTDIAQQYDEDTMVEGKAACKAALQKELGLPVNPDIPLIGFIGRLDYQKGPDLIMDAIDQICGQNVQLVMLGSGDKKMEQSMREAEGRYQERFRGWVGFSVPVSHKITAGADVLLMPSRFEPCGLNQLYAMKYGTVPVVHAAGGLRDTVRHHEEASKDSSTGFVFTTYGGANVEGMMWALNLALRMYWDDRATFVEIGKRGMKEDFTWDSSAARYMQVFEWAMNDPARS